MRALVYFVVVVLLVGCGRPAPEAPLRKLPESWPAVVAPSDSHKRKIAELSRRRAERDESERKVRALEYDIYGKDPLER